jgi:AcrR family transcriptional regulator
MTVNFRKIETGLYHVNTGVLPGMTAARILTEPETGRRSARERILATAMDLFYREGIRAIGIDTIIARSGVAKMSLYRHFASKDELVVAFLSEADRLYWQRWDRVMAEHAGAPRRQLVAFFAMLSRRLASPQYRGCPFINTASEFPDPGHPARAVCLAHKHRLRARLLDLSCRAGAEDPGMLANQLLLLVEGAYSAAQTIGVEATPGLEEAAAALIAAHCPLSSPAS